MNKKIPQKEVLKRKMKNQKNNMIQKIIKVIKN